jgi:hypothetical protein
VYSLPDIRLDWEVYNIICNDDKLLDLVFTYGKPFPLKDKDGNEIEPPAKTCKLFSIYFLMKNIYCGHSV